MQSDISVQILFQIDFVFLQFCSSAVSMEVKGWRGSSLENPPLVSTSLIMWKYFSDVIRKLNSAFCNAILTLKLIPSR